MGFLSWKRLEQLGLSREKDPARVQVKHSVNFGRRKRRGKYDGVPIGNNNHNNHHKESKQQPCVLSIDIGDIAILETQLAADNVAGIMGMDVFSQCSVMRMTFTGPIPRITLFNQPQQQQKQNDSSGSDRDSDSNADSNNN